MSSKNVLPKGYEVVEISDGEGSYEYVVQQVQDELTEIVQSFISADMEADLEAQDYEVFGEYKI